MGYYDNATMMALRLGPWLDAENAARERRAARRRPPERRRMNLQMVTGWFF